MRRTVKSGIQWQQLHVRDIWLLGTIYGTPTCLSSIFENLPCVGQTERAHGPGAQHALVMLVTSVTKSNERMHECKGQDRPRTAILQCHSGLAPPSVTHLAHRKLTNPGAGRADVLDRSD